jgi:hypothetical protein
MLRVAMVFVVLITRVVFMLIFVALGVIAALMALVLGWRTGLGYITSVSGDLTARMR